MARDRLALQPQTGTRAPQDGMGAGSAGASSLPHPPDKVTTMEAAVTWVHETRALGDPTCWEVQAWGDQVRGRRGTVTWWVVSDGQTATVISELHAP